MNKFLLAGLVMASIGCKEKPIKSAKKCMSPEGLFWHVEYADGTFGKTYRGCKKSPSNIQDSSGTFVYFADGQHWFNWGDQKCED